MILLAMKKIKDTIRDLLRGTEKYTQTDMVYLVKGGSWLGAGRVLTMGLTLLMGIAFANFLEPVKYGTYKYVISIVGILSSFTLSGMGTAVARSVARGCDGSLKPAILAEIRWGLLGALGSAIIALHYWYSGNGELAKVFLVALFFLPFFNVFSLYSSILQGKRRFDLIARYDLLAQVLTTILMLAALFLTHDVVWLAVSFLVAGTVIQGLNLLLTTRRLGLNKIIDKETVPYGIKLSLMKGLDLVGVSLYGLLVFHELGAFGMALYAMAIAPIEQVRAFIRMGETLLMPKMASDKWSPGLFGAFVRKMLPMLSLVVCAILAYWVLSPWLFSLVFPKYLDAIPYTRLYSLSLLPTSLGVVLTSVVKAKSDTRTIFAMNITDIAAIFLLTLPLLGFYGLTGVLLSIIILKAIQDAYMVWAIFWRKPLSLKSV